MKYGITTLSFASPITTADTALSIEAAPNEHAEVVECLMTGSGTDAAADTPHTAHLRRLDFATAGTTTSIVPMFVSKGTGVALMSANEIFTAEPTTFEAVEIVAFGFNQRGGMRWAVPRGEGAECAGGLLEDGLAWGVVAQAAGFVDATIQWWE